MFRWGILSTAKIAREQLLPALVESDNGCPELCLPALKALITRKKVVLFCRDERFLPDGLMRAKCA
jgi:hypothetical protein